MLGTYALSSGYYDAYYGQAQRVRTKIAGDFRTAFEKCDFVVTPTSPSVAFKRGERTKDPLAMYLSDFFTVPMSLAGIPAISIPAGLAAGGVRAARRLPDRRARLLRDALLDAAHALESAIAFEGRPRMMTDGGDRSGCREALDALPDWVREELGEVAVIVEDSHPDGIMGIYDPVGGLHESSSFATRTPTPRRSSARSTTRSATTSGWAKSRSTAWASDERPTRRSSAWRSTCSSARGRRCSAAASCPSATTRTSTPARSASPTRAASR